MGLRLIRQQLLLSSGVPRHQHGGMNSSPLRLGGSVTSPWIRLLWVALFLSLPSMVGAQSRPMSLSQTRAANLARMRAESLNGGVSLYRADQCMYSTGAPDCLQNQAISGYRFQFRGGPPGWQQQSPPAPTVITTVTVSSDGQTIRDVSNVALP